MKVIYILVILNSFAFLLNADEEAKTDEQAASPKADDANEENLATTIRGDGTVNTDDIIKGSEFNRLHYNTQNTQLGSFTAFLRDPSNDDEVYKTAALSIKSKNTSNKEKIINNENKTASKSSNEKEKTGSDRINSTETNKSTEDNRTSKEKDAIETENKSLKVKDKSTAENRTLKEKDESTTENRTAKEKNKSVEENRNSKEKVKNIEEHRSITEKDKSVIKKEVHKNLSIESSNKKSSETVTEVEKESETSRTASTPKERSAIDDMDDLIIPYELNKYRRNYDDDDDYDKTLYAKTQDSHEKVEPTLDGVLHNYHQNRRMFDSIPLLDDKGRSKSNEDLEPILQAFNTPTPLKDADLRRFNILSPFLQTPRPPLPYLNSFQSLPNSNKIPNPLMNIQPYQPISFPNRRSQSLETINSPQHLQEMVNNPNGWSYSQEMAYNPNRLEYLQETPNMPNRFHKSQDNTVRLTHPLSNNLNRWSQSQEFPNVLNRWKESHELKDSSEYKNADAVGISSNSNAYPYVPPQTNEMPESNTNPIFMKLAQASNIPQKPQNLPSFLFRNPSFYRPFDSRLNIQRNFPYIPRFRRFSLENYHKMNRVWC